ncbi:hypothetical protein CS379_04005 [Methylobacterium frigidaeris]|nr:hypothetical protein CS379_04005 [Methylobacterium frigidaeris]
MCGSTTAAPAGTINGLFKARAIHRRGPWHCFEAVECATLEWIDGANHRRLARADRQRPSRRGRSALSCSRRRARGRRDRQSSSWLSRPASTRPFLTAAKPNGPRPSSAVGWSPSASG